MNLKKNKSNLKNLPEEPGVYKMMNARGGVIYVGKAKNLKKRVSSYFNRTHQDESRIQHMVDQIESIETIVTPTEYDALILEAQLIKTLQPKYNVLLKDDKSYPYIKVTTQDPFPRIMVVRERHKDKATYFGPYPSIGSTRNLVRMLYDLFPLRDCKQKITLTTQQPKCIQLDLGRCIGPCIYKDRKDAYDKLVADLLLLLSGKNRFLIKKLQKEMMALADQNAFEKAAIIRDRIQKLDRLTQQQIVALDPELTVDIWTVARNEAFFYALTHGIIDGKLLFQKGFFSANTGDQDFETFICQSVINWYTQEKRPPKQILTDPFVWEVLNAAKLQTVIEKFPKIAVPQRGIKHDLLQMGQKNTNIALIRITKEAALPARVAADAVVEDLRDRLGLKKVPYKMLGFDISHLQGQDIVASSVCFENGTPNKKLYRKFKIRSVTEKSHDPASMREAVFRRLRLCLEKDEPIPELLVIDGGKGQLNFALEAVAKLNLTDIVELVALAKREEELYLPGQSSPIKLKKNDPVLHLFQKVRDESHRFALQFQKKRRQNRFKSVLSEIPGIGSIRLNRLYLQFKTLEAITRADPAQIAMTAKVGPERAADLLKKIKEAAKNTTRSKNE